MLGSEVTGTRLVTRHDGAPQVAITTAGCFSLKSQEGFFQSAAEDPVFGYNDGLRNSMRIKSSADILFRPVLSGNTPTGGHWQKLVAGDSPIMNMLEQCNDLQIKAIASTVKQEIEVTCPADDGGSLTGLVAVVIECMTTTYRHRKDVFYITVDGDGDQPEVAGATHYHAVDIDADDTEDDVAAALQAVVDALTGSYSASVTDEVVTIEYDMAGPQPDAAVVSGTGFSFSETVAGVSTAGATVDVTLW